MPRRLPNVDVRLVEWQTSVLGRPFEWGRTDCGALVWSALEAIYPEDDVPLPPGIRPWRSEPAALRLFARVGGVAGALRAGGAETVPLAFAQNGDIIIAAGPEGGVPGAAIVVGPGYVVANRERGVERRSLRNLRESDPPGALEVWRPPL